MRTRKLLIRTSAVSLGLFCVLALTASIGSTQVPRNQVIDANGAPMFKVDPFWPKPLKNRWSMQQVTGIGVDHMDHIWFVNRGAVAEGDEIGGGDNPPRIDCCVRGPEIIELDQEGNVLNAWGGPGYHPQWPTAMQTVIADKKGFVWIAGTAAAGQHHEVHARREVRVGLRASSAGRGGDDAGEQSGNLVPHQQGTLPD